MKRRRIRIIPALFAQVLWFGMIILATSALTQASHTHRHPAKKRPSIPAKARRIALERYRFLKRLEPKFGELPIYRYPGDTAASDVTMFPVGRSDRLYVFLWDSGYQKDFTNTSQMFCYQHQEGKDQLVYQVNLEDKLRPANKVKSIKSSMNYVNSYIEYDEDKDGKTIHLHSVSIVGTLSDLAQKDLAANRDYVEYKAEPFDGAFSVTLLSSTHDDVYDSYNLTEDPYTKATLNDDAFFAKYGLLVAKKELPLLH